MKSSTVTCFSNDTKALFQSCIININHSHPYYLTLKAILERKKHIKDNKIQSIRL